MRRRHLALAVGLVMAGGHGVAFPWLVGRLDRAPLRVRVHAPLAAAGPRVELALSTELPPDLAARVRLLVDGQEIGPMEKLACRVARSSERTDCPPGPPRGPGLHRIEWRARYRGGAVRRVGWTQLVGPYQDTARPPCSARFLVGQQFLDDGRAGRGTLAEQVARLVGEEMAGFDAFPVGTFEGVRGLGMRWIGPGGGEDGHLRVALELGFSKARLELTIRIAPRLVAGQLRLGSHTDARVRLKSRFVQWLSDLIDGDEIAARMARREVALALDQVMTAPPPLPLGGGRELELTYCRDRDIQVMTDSYASVPLAVVLAPAAAAARRAGRVGSPVLLPPSDGPTADATPMSAPLAVELDGNALNGLLYVLWATGTLEQALAASGLLDRFHDDPVVSELLSVRARGPTLPLPPTLVASSRSGLTYEIAVASALWLDDGDLHTPALIFGRAGFDLAITSAPGRRPGLAPRLSLHDLGLTCEPEPGLLEPCYAELAAQLIERAPEVHGQLSAWFSELLARLLIDRDILLPRSKVWFRLRQSAIHGPPAGHHGPLRIDLMGRLETVR